MRYVELICEAAHAAHLNQPGLGVRLSPTSLTAQEARELAAVAPSLLGAEVYVAVAAPGAAPLEEDRVCVAPGERAAERATEWRNLLGPAEWLLYVSAERLGRAGGLHDTLRALPSRALNDAFAKSSRNRLPEALIAALREVDLLFTAQARALCAYEEAVGEAPEASRWAVAGERLPLLGLAADSGLAHDPVERLRGNLAWVQGASGADPRRASSVDPRRAALAAAIQGAEGEDRAHALQGVDLGAIPTQTLSPPKKPRAPRAAPASPAHRAPREASPAPRAGAPASAVSAASSVAASASSAPAPTLSASVPSSPPSALAASVTSSVGASPPAASTTPPPPVSPATGIAPAPLPVGPPPPLPWLTGTEPPPPMAPPAVPEGLPFTPAPVVGATWERREAPEGLLIALKALLADGGAPRRWLARGTRPRDALARSTKGELPVEALPAPKLSRELTEAVAAWRAARETLRAALRRAGADDEALARLGVVPSAAMVGEVKDAATAVVQRAARALGLARAPEALTWLLAHDAALIEDPLSDEALLAPGPLHPLCLAGALARADEAQLADEATPEEPWARWGLSQPLPRPARWPAPGGGALLASAPYGLAPVYETRPAPAPEAALRSITARLTRRLVELHPHVLLGLGVLVDHDRPGAVVDGLVDGLTAALDQLPRALPATRLTVYTATTPALGSAASRWVVEGRLILAPSPLDAASRERLPAQLHLRVPPPPAPAQVAISAPLTAPPGRPTYTTIDGGWAERLPHTCVPEGEALADAVQRALHAPSEGAFTTTRAAARAEPTRTRALWRAELAELLPPPTAGATLLIDERSEGLQARVYSADLRALAERLTEVLGKLDPQAKTEEARVEYLRAQCAGGAALTLDDALSRALGVRQRERALRDELGAGALIVSVGPELLGALGLPPLATPLLLGLALKDTLAVRVARVEPLEAEGARRDGAGTESRVLALVQAAARAEGSADVQARALLAAMVWPALQPSAHGGLALWLNGGRLGIGQLLPTTPSLDSKA